jgi:hypothetical protein
VRQLPASGGSTQSAPCRRAPPAADAPPPAPSAPSTTPPGHQTQSNAQLDGAFDYLKRVGPGAASKPELEEAAGVGVVVTPEQIAAAVGVALEANKERLLEERCALGGGGEAGLPRSGACATDCRSGRPGGGGLPLSDLLATLCPPIIFRYHMNTNILLAGITKQLKWADGGKVRRGSSGRLAAGSGGHGSGCDSGGCHLLGTRALSPTPSLLPQLPRCARR